MKKIKTMMIALLSDMVMRCSNSNSTADCQIIDNAEQVDTEGANAENTIDTEEPSWAIGYANGGIGEQKCVSINVANTGEE